MPRPARPGVVQRGELGVDLGEPLHEPAHGHAGPVSVQQRLEHAGDPAGAPPRPVVQIEEAVGPRQVDVADEPEWTVRVGERRPGQRGHERTVVRQRVQDVSSLAPDMSSAAEHVQPVAIVAGLGRAGGEARHCDPDAARQEAAAGEVGAGQQACAAEAAPVPALARCTAGSRHTGAVTERQQHARPVDRRRCQELVGRRPLAAGHAQLAVATSPATRRLRSSSSQGAISAWTPSRVAEVPSRTACRIACASVTGAG